MNSVIRRAAKTSFGFADRLLGPFPGPRFLIYHQIGAGHGREMDVRPDAFVAHLDWIGKAGKRIVSLGEAIAGRREEYADDLVVLTFDDGYADMYDNGFPILAERRLPFTLYITTEPTETRRPLAPERRSTPLTWDQINEMRDSDLATIAAHTHSHPDLRHLDAGAIERDLETSDRLIERRTGIQPVHFAYPWGYWAPAADQVVRDRYQSAVLGGGEPIRPESDPMLLHRIPVQLSDGVEFFKAKLQRGQRSEEFVRRRLTGYRGP